MECEKPRYAGGLVWKAVIPAWKPEPGAVGRQLGGGDVGAPRQLAGSPYQPPRPPHHSHTASTMLDTQHDSFMNEMDEISYWVYTKRAPCLMNFDNQIKKQYDLTQSAKLANEQNLAQEALSPKKKKRKLSLLDDDCVSVEKQNVFFETSQQKQRSPPSSCRSDTLESDVDFNLKNSSIKVEPKKRAKKKYNGRTIHKKNKVVTSTPLRRSLRNTQNCSNTDVQLNSYNLYYYSNLNGTTDQSNARTVSKSVPRSKKPLNRRLNDLGNIEQNKSEIISKSKNKNIQNEQFEDLSDVSGFTANYIRSTKVHSNAKPNRSLRSKNNRNLMKQTRPQTEASVAKRSTMLVCVNKSMNTASETPLLNCSTGSSQNVINLVTTKICDKNVKVNKSTSLLKFVDLKSTKEKLSDSCGNLPNKVDLNISCQSGTTSNSRYPKRQNKSTKTSQTIIALNRAPDKKQAKKMVECNLTDSERKENPDEDTTVSRTRSGRNLSLALRQPNSSKLAETSLLVSNNSTEEVNTLNVGAHHSKTRSRKVLSISTSQLKKSVDSSEAAHRKSLRERSGFAACFSDSDDDSDALKQRKFFC